MKKINSILAIAAVAITSVLGFTSCDKNDDAFNNQTPVVQGTSGNNTTASNNTTANGNNSSSQAGIYLMKITENNNAITPKNVDTNYVVGEWTATINDTVYTLVVSSDCSKHNTDTEYKATLRVGDKSYDGIYMAPNNVYSGRFDSNALNADGKTAVVISFSAVNESTLSEMTTTYLDLNGNLVVDDACVKFVKK